MRIRAVAVGIVATAIIVQLFPTLAAVLIFDRVAIDVGEIWRVVTGSLVHFSWAHLTGDAVVLLVAAFLLPARSLDQAGLIIGAMGASGVAVWLLAPELRWYGGLSGVSHAAVVYVALNTLRAPGPPRVIAGAVLVTMAAKLVVDATVVRAFAGTLNGEPIVVAPASHLGAVAYAAILFAAVTLSHFARRPPGLPSLSQEHHQH